MNCLRALIVQMVIILCLITPVLHCLYLSSKYTVKIVYMYVYIMFTEKHKIFLIYSCCSLVFLFVCLLVCCFVYLLVCLSVCLFVVMFIYLFVCLFVGLCVGLFPCVFICFSVCLFIYLFISFVCLLKNYSTFLVVCQFHGSYIYLFASYFFPLLFANLFLPSLSLSFLLLIFPSFPSRCINKHISPLFHLLT